MKAPSRIRTFLYGAVTVVIAVAALEIVASWMLLLHYRSSRLANFEAHDPSYLATVNLARRLGRLVGLAEPVAGGEQTEPSPFFRADRLLGYSAAPGVYTHSYGRRNAMTGQWEYHRNKVTIESDGTRWTGAPRPGKPTVHIFGDSWVFGTGVPDELTFAARLREALPDWNVRLSALGGWALTQAHLNFDQLKEVRPDDIVVLGYADYYDVRHVVAPSRLREIEAWLRTVGQPIPPFLLPKASLGPHGKLAFSYLDQRCAALGDYCRQPDPSPSEMAAVTAGLVDHFAEASAAKVYLLHFAGSPDNPALAKLSPKIGRISALRRDFDSVVQDDIMGFDGHPGPFWHYAISRKLLAAIAWQRP
ncbi:MAG: hypothetical protein FJX11_14915 [Alphaproteobacteria bacterium]|nr:hypothetical protein [Alphaproteobacteria bacterium]